MGSPDKIRLGYHNVLRPEILELIPTNAKSVLDLGCGSGVLGKALKEQRKCHVDGVEINKEAAHVAESNLDKVWHDNLNRFDPVFLKQKYDCLVFADILEHLIAPWVVLKKFVPVLSPGGVIVASLPNVAHPWVVAQLQKGLFRYDEAGILDITHLRFFTKTSIFQLFAKAGLKILNIRPYPSKANPIQYHVQAVKPVYEHKSPLVTIIILTLNCWRYTAMCINSIKARTHFPYKILVVDNGSSDETVRRLREDVEILHVENSCNLGFGRGFNIGLELVDTPYYVVCNNDVVVTDGWLTGLLAAIDRDDKLVAVGPVSNYASGPQLVKEVEYGNEGTLEAFALERLKHTPEGATYARRIVFFCTLFKTFVISDIGFFDERFELGNFEDDDYCMRIAKAKLKAAYVPSVFVHHYGSQSFRENEINYTKALNENEIKFKKKWGV